MKYYTNYIKIIIWCKSTESNGISTDETIVVGCDGTAVNTGRKFGVIAMREKRLKRPLQRLVCLLHANEHLLGHLIQILNAKITGNQ